MQKLKATQESESKVKNNLECMMYEKMNQQMQAYH